MRVNQSNGMSALRVLLSGRAAMADNKGLSLDDGATLDEMIEALEDEPSPTSPSSLGALCIGAGEERCPTGSVSSKRKSCNARQRGKRAGGNKRNSMLR